MKNETVLIVDDEARIRKLVKDFLNKEGYSCLEAEDRRKCYRIV